MKRFLGSRVDLPESDVRNLPANNDYFLIIYLEEGECIPCALNKVTLLKQYKNDLDKFNIGVVLITKENENREDVINLFSNMSIEYPLLFDKDDYLFKNNPIISSNTSCRTFIIDKDMKVVFIGSPIENNESVERFRKTMTKLTKTKS
jgi:peroxiredoxin